MKTARQTVPVIDVHSHFIPFCYLDGLKEQGVDPLEEDGFPTPPWSPEAHLAYMDQGGITHSVISLSSPHIHHGDGASAIRLARRSNEEAAAICRTHPDRFSFAACLPMPEIKASVDEIRYAFDELGAVGIKVASNSNGVYLGDPVFDPIFAELNRRKAVINIHPCRPPLVPERVFTCGPAPLFEFLADTTRAIINLLISGTLEKYPDISVVVPHTGSFLPLLIHRLTGISKVLGPKGLIPETDIWAAFQTLYFDTAGDFHTVALRTLLRVADPTHILYGGDFPYTPVNQIQSAWTDLTTEPEIQPYLQAILYGNATRLYRL